MKKYKRGYTTGVFDMFHIGHLNILKRAKEYCEYLIVGVSTDKLCYSRKNKYPIIEEGQREEIVRAIKYVDEVVKQEDMNKEGMVRKLGCDVVFVGSDWQNTEQWKVYEEQFRALNCDVVYLPHTEGISSSILRTKKLNEKN